MDAGKMYRGRLKGTVNLTGLCSVAILLVACGDGQRQYRGGHELPNTFEVFSFNNPLGEVGGVLLYMLLPVAIGTAVSLFVTHFWSKRSESDIRPLSRLPTSIMCGVILASFGYYVALLALTENQYEEFSFLLLLFLSAPVWSTLFIVGPFLLADIMLRRNNGSLPAWAAYMASVSGLVAEYFWLSSLNQA